MQRPLSHSHLPALAAAVCQLCVGPSGGRVWRRTCSIESKTRPTASEPASACAPTEGEEPTGGRRAEGGGRRGRSATSCVCSGGLEAAAARTAKATATGSKQPTAASPPPRNTTSTATSTTGTATSGQRGWGWAVVALHHEGRAVEALCEGVAGVPGDLGRAGRDRGQQRVQHVLLRGGGRGGAAGGGGRPGAGAWPVSGQVAERPGAQRERAAKGRSSDSERAVK